MELNRLKAWELLPRLEKKEISATELVTQTLAEIGRTGKTLNTFITVTAEQALSQAKQIDARRGRGEKVGALAGIPIAIKDVICTQGIQTTCGSRILTGFVPPYDATVITKLKVADAVIVGKTNMDEFAMGSSNENSAFGPVRNPHDPSRIPGGSSGGSAAAVAAHQAIFALGSETGGSVRQPASLCGVVGLKPTYGAVSRWGLVAFASSLDQIGSFGRDVRDCALLFDIIAGGDPRDSTSRKAYQPHCFEKLRQEPKSFRIGVPKEYFALGIEPDVERLVRGAIDRIGREGVPVEEVSLPSTDKGIATYYIIAPAEASSNLARYDGVKYGLRVYGGNDDLLTMYGKTRQEGFRPEVKRRIMLGTYVLSAGYYEAYYLKAQKLRAQVKKDFDDAFRKVDLLVCPTSPTAAFKLGEKVDDPLTMYLNDVYTVTANLAGIPAISIPCGKTKAGLPVGLQILAPPFAEEKLFQFAHWVEGILKSS